MNDQENKTSTPEQDGLAMLTRSWSPWVQKGFNRYARAEKVAKINYSLFDYPEWAIRMMMELWKMVGPGFRLDDETKSGPATLAAMVGHTEVVLLSVDTGLIKATEVLQKKERALNQKLCATLTKQQIAAWTREQANAKDQIQRYKQHVASFLKIFECVARRKLKICKQIIAEAAKQEFPEKKEFFTAYARALNRKVFDEDGHLHHQKPTSEPIPSSTIYNYMIFNYREVNEFKDFAELRCFLEKRFGRGRIGNPDRLTHLCQRHSYNPSGSPNRGTTTNDEVPVTPTILSDYILTSDVLKIAKRLTTPTS